MNIIANNVASKLFVAFVAAAMLFTLATPAQAQTASELEAQIKALMAQIAALQGGSTGGSSSAACTFTRALTTGSQGADVTCLQNYLISKGFSIPAGATGYFGAQSQSAVAAWQSANGVMPAAGYFGPVSQAKYSALVAAGPSTDGDDEDNDTSDLSGEADLNSFEVNDGEDADDVEEGSEGVSVAEFDIEFNDGDAMITRIDIALLGDQNTVNTEADPWDVFENVALVVDGDEVASIDASDKDEYLDEDDGTLRFSGLDIVAMEDEEITVSVVADITGSVDSAGSATLADWDVAATSLRFVDADDVTTTDDSTGDIDGISPFTEAVAEFTIEAQGAGDDLDLESSDDDPDATTFGLDENHNTEEAIFAFDLSAEDSDTDIDLNEILVGVVVSSSTVDTFVNDFRLEIDGQSFNAETYANVGSTTLTFDIDGDVTIDADEVVTAVLYADFENMAQGGNEGTTIHATTSAANIDAEGADDVVVDGGTVVGETHTLRVEGVDATLTSSSETIKANTDTTTTDDEGVFKLKFDVTAFGDDLYIDDTAEDDTTESNFGVNFTIEDSTGAVIASSTGTAVATLDSSADQTSGGYFKVKEGTTETFTLTVEFDPASTGSYKVVLYSVNFNSTSDTAADTQQLLSPESSYDSGLLTI